MREVFADTHYYLALINSDDAAHDQALSLSEALDDPVVTTSWVLTEVADAFSAPRRRKSFLRLLDALHADSNCTVKPATQDLFGRFTVLCG